MGPAVLVPGGVSGHNLGGMLQLYELNVRTWRTERSAQLGRPATLDDLTDDVLDDLVETGFTWLYLFGLWPTGPLARGAAIADRQLGEYLGHVLPGFHPDDVAGSPQAPAGYAADPDLGGDAALARLRHRARASGLSLMLDVFPNHVGLDHPWVTTHPSWFIRGDEAALNARPDAHVRLGDHVFCHGRDPFFAPWRATAQLDFANPAVQEAVTAQLVAVAARCDGLRCDLAMLLLEDVFAGTWGRRVPQFWPRAIAAVRALHPGTLFVAEVYWDREYDLQQTGFDYTYDKRLYDRLLIGDAGGIRAHLGAAIEYQRRTVRFLENHNEPRAAARFRNSDHHRGALFITGMVPGMLLCHHGQEDGRVLHTSLPACRRPPEPGSSPHRDAYRDLMYLLGESARMHGTWSLLPARGDAPLIACLWTQQSHHGLLVVVNASWHPVQAAVDATPLAGRDGRFQEVFSGTSWELAASDLRQGLTVELPAWGTLAVRVMGR
jgi:hypothetical protein